MNSNINLMEAKSLKSKKKILRILLFYSFVKIFY